MGFVSPSNGFFLTLRRHCPVSIFLAGVTVGECGAWFCSLPHVLVVLVMIGVLVGIGVGRLGAFWSGVLIGLVAANSSMMLRASPLEAHDVELLVEVQEIPSRRKPGEVSFVGLELLGDTRGVVRCRAVELPWRNAGALRKGDVLWVRGDVQGTRRPMNPFSWEGRLYRQGIRGEMKVLFASRPVPMPASFVDKVRDGVLNTVRKTLGDTRGAALFLSMAFGFRDVLSSPVEEMFASLGLSHLLVVSGYQVSLVFGCVFGVVTKCGARILPGFGARYVATGVSFAVATLYVLLVGSEMSAMRALIAAACLCAAFMLDRRHGFFQRWAVALLIMEIVWPWAFFEVGVLLTFAALAGIGIGSLLGGSSRVGSVLWVSVCVWLLTSTIVVFFSGALSLASIVLNVLLASVWSVLNCAIGGIGLLLTSTHLSPGVEILSFVSFCNEVITEWLFKLSSLMNLSTKYEGGSQLIVGALLASLSMLCAIGACLRHKGATLRAMAR